MNPQPRPCPFRVLALFGAIACGCSSDDGEHASGEVPADLVAVEEIAEDAYDQALAGDPAKVVTALSTASGDDSIALARAANAVSATMDELFALYEPAIPPDVLALDYLGREVVLDAKAGELEAATTDVDAIDSRWSPLRASVVAAGGTQQADEYEASIAAMRADISAMDEDALVVDANVGLELVDAIENAFEP